MIVIEIDLRISIHAPLAGSDFIRLFHVPTDVISIHAPLAGSDKVTVYYCSYVSTISIHAPLAGSDNKIKLFRHGVDISIHAPLAGSDANRQPMMR